MSRLGFHVQTRNRAAGLRGPLTARGPSPRTVVSAIGAQGIRPQLADVLPAFFTWNVYAAEIQLPAATLFGPSLSSLSACYCLESIRIPQDAGHEIGLAGMMVELLPTESAGGIATYSGAPATSTGWGTTRGDAAALIVGTNLGIPDKTWAPMAVQYPGVETFAFDLDSPVQAKKYIDAFSFPTGKLNDTTPNKLYLPRAYLPALYPLTEQSTLDVVLAVRRSQLATDGGVTWSSGAAKAILCHIRVQLMLMRVVREDFWNRE